MADKNDLTYRYNTQLPLHALKRYEAWRKSLPKLLQSTYDYDLTGAFLGGGGISADAHMTDRWKKPNHPLFSVESMYSTPENPGGSWDGDVYIPPSIGLRLNEALRDRRK